MKLVKLAWRNICSYGNKIQEFVFSNEPELILVEGKNGSGKSSIKEALTIGVEDYILKPITREKLTVAINNIKEKRQKKNRFAFKFIGNFL